MSVSIEEIIETLQHTHLVSSLPCDRTYMLEEIAREYLDKLKGGNMGYPVDLDQLSENSLREELDKRKKLREEGKCDYCERFPSTEPCRYPHRHYDERIVSSSNSD